MTTPMQLQTRPRGRGGLESVAIPLPLGEEDWRGGVGFTPLGAPVLFTWPVVCTANPDLAVKPLREGVEALVEFQPFVIGAGATCGPGRGPLGDTSRILAESALELNRYSLLAAAMFTGDTGSDDPNPGLHELAGITPAGFDATAPNTVRPTIQGLLDTVCEHGGGDYVFHVPLQYLPHVKAELGLTWNEQRGVWTLGQFDFSFDCYENRGPDDVEAATPTVDDGATFWIWLTRRPQVAFSDDVTVSVGLDTRINERIVIAEQQAIVVVDPTAVAAAKARVA